MKMAAAAAMLALFVLPAGCADGSAGGFGGGLFAEPLPDTTSMREVYADGAVTVEAGELHTAPCPSDSDAPGGQICLLRVKLTNGSERSIAIASRLCLEVTSGGAPCAVLSSLDAAVPPFEGVERVVPFDGLIRPGQTREGYVAFTAPAGSTSFEFRLATCYAEDEWIGFTF